MEKNGTGKQEDALEVHVKALKETLQGEEKSPEELLEEILEKLRKGTRSAISDIK